MIAKALKDAAVRAGLFPNIVFTLNPFKIFEFDEVLKGLKLAGSEVVLDIGSGNGLQTMLLAKKCGRIVGIDLNGDYVASSSRRADYMSRVLKNPSNIEFRRTTVEDAGFPPDSFDAVVSICVLEHIADYAGTLRECRRVLKKGGRLVISADSLGGIKDAKLLEKHRKDHFVEQYFTKDGLRKVLEDAGFSDVSVYPIFRSGYSKNLFAGGIRDGFRYGMLSLLPLYIRISLAERMFRGDGDGIFLIAVCRK